MFTESTSFLVAGSQRYFSRLHNPHQAPGGMSEFIVLDRYDQLQRLYFILWWSVDMQNNFGNLV
jgi:hypothetical protein